MNDEEGAPPEPEPVLGILVTHGAMAQGMVDAVRKITGFGEDVLVAVSNDGRGPDALLKAVQEVAGTGPAIIFTDLPSGSCAMAARFVCRDPGNRSGLFGTNLPMLLDFVFHRDLALDELVERLLKRGRSEIRSLERPANRAAPRADDPCGDAEADIGPGEGSSASADAQPAADRHAHRPVSG